MLLKPNEVDYIELDEEQEVVFSELDNEDEGLEDGISADKKLPFIQGKTILIGGTEEPIYLEDDLIFSTEDQEDEDEFYIFGGEPIIIGADFPRETEYDYSSESDDLISENTSESSESLYGLDSEFGSDFLYEPDFSEDGDFGGIKGFESSSGDWLEKKHTTLIGRVDSQLLDKIKEYRENVHEMSETKLLSLDDFESRDRLLSEAANLIDEVEDLPAPSDINSLIGELDRKMSNIINKHIDTQVDLINRERELMLKEVEKDIEEQISQQIAIIQQEAEEHIDETVQYYKKKMEGDNHLLSSANNIISRREQILDDAYAKSLSTVEDSEEKARTIIERASNAQAEAELIIAQSEAKRDDIVQEAEIEAERIISDANVESARIIQAAEDQHQDIVEAATQDGFSVGYQEGKEEAIKENSELLREAVTALNKLHAAFPVAVKQNEDKLVKIAYQISNSIIGESVMERPELCQKTINLAVRQVSDFDLVKIKVNPSDLDVILPKQEYFKMILPDVQEYIISGDNDIMKGSCLIITETDGFKVSISTQLSILEAVFNEAIADL